MTIVRLVLATSVLGLVCSASVQKGSPGERRQTWKSPSATSGYGWCNETWNGSPEAYRKVRSALEAIRDNRSELALQTKKWKDRSQRKPKDSLSAFGWAQAAFLENIQRDIAMGSASPADEALLHLSKVTSPHNIEFSTVRFLIEARRFPNHELIPLGRKLLRVDSNDLSVMYAQTLLLNTSRQPEDMAEGLRFSQDFAKKNPKDWRSKSLVGDAYTNYWIVKKDRSAAQKAIAAYKEALSLRKSGEASGRTWLQHLIATLERDLKK